MAPDLAQSEQVEMVDDHGGDQDQEPAERVAGMKQCDAERVVDFPNGSAERTPLPEQEYQGEAAGQHIGTALHLLRDHFCYDALERGSCHDAVLQGKEQEKTQ